MRNAYKVWLKSLKGRDHLEDLGVDGKVVLKLIIMDIGLEDLHWIHLAQDKDKRIALVNTVISLRVSYSAGSSLISFSRGTLLLLSYLVTSLQIGTPRL
jgi:hypothetical protein